MKIMGIDPGKTTGIAIIDIEHGKIRPIYFAECKDETLFDIQHLFGEVDLIVCEKFDIDPKFARAGKLDGDNMPAPRVIGAATLLAKMHKTRFELQSRTIKPVGYGLSNQLYQKGKAGMHNQDALAHAVFFAVKYLGALPVSKR